MLTCIIIYIKKTTEWNETIKLGSKYLYIIYLKYSSLLQVQRQPFLRSRQIDLMKEDRERRIKTKSVVRIQTMAQETQGKNTVDRTTSDQQWQARSLSIFGYSLIKDFQIKEHICFPHLWLKVIKRDQCRGLRNLSLGISLSSTQQEVFFGVNLH